MVAIFQGCNPEQALTAAESHGDGYCRDIYGQFFDNTNNVVAIACSEGVDKIIADLQACLGKSATEAKTCVTQAIADSNAACDQQTDRDSGTADPKRIEACRNGVLDVLKTLKFDTIEIKH